MKLNKAWDLYDKTHFGIPNEIKDKAKGLLNKKETSEPDAMNAEANAAFNQAQSSLTKEAPQIEQEMMASVESKPISANIEAAQKPLAFSGPETSQALERIAENRYKDDIQKLRIRTRDEARKMETQNRAKAFENLIEKNKLAQQAHARRMERKQARYAAKMGVVSAIMQAGGMAIGGAAGAQAAGSMGPKPGAGQGTMISGEATTAAGQPNTSNRRNA